VRLTEKFIEKTQPTETRLQFLDDDVRGFGLRIEPNGRKSLYWRAKVRGDVVMRSFGEYKKDIGLTEARDEARELAVKAATWRRKNFEGPSPFYRDDPSEVPTFNTLLEAYIGDHLRENANRPAKAEADLRWRIAKHFASWKNRRIDSITKHDVRAVKRACGENKVTANRCVEFVRALFNWCAKSEDPRFENLEIENPGLKVKLYKEAARERFLQPDEVIRFNEVLKKEEHSDLADFLVIAINTGARRSDILSMRWQDIQWNNNGWYVPHPKNGRAYTVSLLPAARTVLERRRKEAVDSDVYVFPGVGKTKHLVDLKKSWTEFRKKADLKNFRMHDIRRTVGSYMAMQGANLPTIAAALGHTSLGAVQVYAKLHPDAARDAREAGQAKMIAMMRDQEKRQKRLKSRAKQRLLA
jgi:integrase